MIVQRVKNQIVTVIVRAAIIAHVEKSVTVNAAAIVKTAPVKILKSVCKRRSFFDIS